jgi:hypothetical protein
MCFTAVAGCWLVENEAVVAQADRQTHVLAQSFAVLLPPFRRVFLSVTQAVSPSMAIAGSSLRRDLHESDASSCPVLVAANRSLWPPSVLAGLGNGPHETKTAVHSGSRPLYQGPRAVPRCRHRQTSKSQPTTAGNGSSAPALGPWGAKPGRDRDVRCRACAHEDESTGTVSTSGLCLCLSQVKTVGAPPMAMSMAL